MATDKQIAANRRNAQLCTGPTSQRGKAVSSLNALKTGVHHQAELTSQESTDDYRQLTAEYYEDFEPANPAERNLVDQLIRNEWLNRRFAAVDSAIWDSGLDSAGGDLAKAFGDSSDNLLKLDRIRNSIQRNYNKSLHQLLALRKARGAAVPVHGVPPEPPVQPEAAEALIPELVSFRNFHRAPQFAPENDLPETEEQPMAA